MWRNALSALLVTAVVVLGAAGVVGAYVLTRPDGPSEPGSEATKRAVAQDEKASRAGGSTSRGKLLRLTARACRDLGGESQGRKLSTFDCELPASLGRSTRSVVAHVDDLCVRFFGSPCSKWQIDTVLDKLNVYERAADSGEGSGQYQPIPGPACGFGGCEKSGRCPLGAQCLGG